MFACSHTYVMCCVAGVINDDDKRRQEILN